MNGRLIKDDNLPYPRSDVLHHSNAPRFLAVPVIHQKRPPYARPARLIDYEFPPA